jgi:hypothetical protein
MFTFVIVFGLGFALDLGANLVLGNGKLHWTTDIWGVVGAVLLMGLVHLMVKGAKGEG